MCLYLYIHIINIHRKYILCKQKPSFWMRLIAINRLTSTSWKSTFLFKPRGYFAQRKRKNQGSRSFLTFTSPAKMVAISPCMNAQGTLDPISGHFLRHSGSKPLQSPPAVWCSPREHGNNLCDGNGRALDEMCVLEALVAQGAAQRHASGRHRGIGNALRMPGPAGPCLGCARWSAFPTFQR